MKTQHFPEKERGAALFIALIMLLVITLLALSGARETALESRITGNLADQQKLVNYGEAALRQGERLLTSPMKPREQNDCTGNYCFLNQQPAYLQDFDTSLSYSPVTGESNQQVQWYAVPAPSGAAQGQAENPEYGNMMLGIGTFRYEINTKATNTDTEQKASLRSTTAKVFN
ncbi:PilX N-terminal domain-containing pilus assembly protein [Pseudomonas sp. GOM7]|uniref:pilus assembly PilX family protein n=1 Tax=Pseudomonas sp. GOM7 TaxID=2998079 RepID=UPI00227D384D|nr:PilX N-terminal domain-containing pilus assembly protein [Pseudomonas sp. GOM7]WAJ36650.1 PilX N-terminal domain-containing pilus assembly protein [Pseudomonas sp. GOM7]